mgnify:CR=1 FL=1
MTPREKISPNRLSQTCSQKVRITRHPDHLEDELPENSCRCENLQSEAKWSLAGSLYGNGLKYSAYRKSHSAEFCWVSQTRSKPDGTSPKRSSLPASHEIRLVGGGGPTSVSQPPKTFDGSTSASVSLRSVEPSSKSPFEVSSFQPH